MKATDQPFAVLFVFGVFFKLKFQVGLFLESSKFRDRLLLLLVLFCCAFALQPKRNFITNNTLNYLWPNVKTPCVVFIIEVKTVLPKISNPPKQRSRHRARNTCIDKLLYLALICGRKTDVTRRLVTRAQAISNQ